MTQSEEIVTLKGESKEAIESVFLYNKNMEVSYSTSIHNRKGIEIRLHHPNVVEAATFQMIFVLKGNLQIKKTGSEIIYSEIDSHQHNLCRLPFKTSRLLVSAADDVVFINISNSFLKRFLPEGHPAYQQLFKVDLTDNPMALSALNMQITPEISAILQKLGNSNHSTFSNQLLLESKAIELFALQISQFEQLQNNEVPAKLKRVEMDRMHEVREILINQSGDQLSLRSLAHLVGTNEFNLKRDFKALFGKTVFAYLNQHKMEKAKKMLIEDDATIAEIAKRTGYKHATHFTNAFKKYFGFLPHKIKAGKLSLLIFLEDFLALLENLCFTAI